MENKILKMVEDKKTEIVQKIYEAFREIMVDEYISVSVCIDTETEEVNLIYGNYYNNCDDNDFILYTVSRNNGESIFDNSEPSDCLDILFHVSENPELLDFCKNFLEEYKEEHYDGDLNRTVFDRRDYNIKLWKAITECDDFEDDLKKVRAEIFKETDISVYKETYLEIFNSLLNENPDEDFID